MIQKTVKGKKCPRCFSFVEENTSACSVCGYRFNGSEVDANEPAAPPQPPELTVIGKEEIKCGKCGTINKDDFKFCKICRHPLTNAKEERDEMMTQESKESMKTSRIGSPEMITLDWIKIPHAGKTREQLKLINFLPYFDGYAQWKGYIFFVYQDTGTAQYEILTRKISMSTESKLFKKYKDVFVERSGKEFYLGTLKLQLLGEQPGGDELKTIMKSEQTLFVGPGEEYNGDVRTGKPGLKVFNLSTQKEFIEIPERVLIGRNFLADQWKVDPDTLRKNGISKEHMVLTPLPGGNWLIEPLLYKSLYIEIDETPQILKENDILRWTAKDQLGEFKINIKINR